MTRARGRRVMTDTDNTKDVEFFSIFDGKVGRPDGVYLDMQERVQAEALRAAAEGREPETDLGKLPAATGTPLVIESQRVDTVPSNPPMGSIIEAKEVDPVATLPVDSTPAAVDVDLSLAAQVAKERRAQEDSLANEDAAADSVEPEATAPGPDNDNVSFDSDTYNDVS